MLHLYLRNYST